MRSRSPDFWSGLALAALGGYIVMQARGWDYATEDGPGPGFFPLWYGLGILACAAFLVFFGKDSPADWRGAGRAFYFSPLHMLQSVFSPWIAAEMEAPDEQAFKGLKAGITWATNVVNMRQPEIFEDLIARRGAAEESAGTIRNGVAASTTMAIDITPNHPVVKAYLDYKPKSSDPKVQELWEKLVHEPAYRAVTRYQPILKRHKMLDQVFRFQDLDALVDRLEASEAGTGAKTA